VNNELADPVNNELADKAFAIVEDAPASRRAYRTAACELWASGLVRQRSTSRCSL
jgi:hypothetical protein